jgi:hypothetical protein
MSLIACRKSRGAQVVLIATVSSRPARYRTPSASVCSSCIPVRTLHGCALTVGAAPRLVVRLKHAHGRCPPTESPEVENSQPLAWKAGEMADTQAPGGILMRICPMRLHRWVSLCETAVYSWLDDRAPTMGAAIAYYTVFSLAPMLVMVIAIAGLAFGQKAAEGALFDELADLVGAESAGAVQAMLRSASSTRTGILATVVGSAH